MIETSTGKRLEVLPAGSAGWYLHLPLSQLDDVQQVLTRHDIRHWVGENAISIDGGPEMIIVNLGRNADPAAIQAILDCVA